MWSMFGVKELCLFNEVGIQCLPSLHKEVGLSPWKKISVSSHGFSRPLGDLDTCLIPNGPILRSLNLANCLVVLFPTISPYCLRAINEV
ncbi:hypothetical protein Hdeb2414_s0006g00189611 [Helianthus debilis subsp. tardiflorus]